MGFLIGVDPGHGMGNRRDDVYDPGAVVAGIDEADIALAYALTLKSLAPRFGLEVWLTRESREQSAPLRHRAERARVAGCDALISIHANAGPPSATGIETFFAAAGSLSFARTCQAAVIRALALPDRGVKHESLSRHRRLAVLRFPRPCCLIELGFLTHETDHQVLSHRDSRIRFAHLLLDAIRAISKSL